MRYLATHEHAPRGTFDFPIELYYVDPSHPRYEMPFQNIPPFIFAQISQYFSYTFT